MYLLVTYKRQAAGTIDEEVSVVRRLKTSDIQMCNVIMNYKEQKVEKCLIEGNKVDTSFELLHEYYKKIYPNYITQLEFFVSQPEPVLPEPTKIKPD